MISLSSDAAEFILYPFPFRTRHNRYLYDPGSNEILEVDPILFDHACTAFLEIDPGRAWQNLRFHGRSAKEIRKARSAGLLRADTLRIVPSPDIETLPDTTQEFAAPASFVIEVTQDCNLRCTYCGFSGCDEFRRSRTRRFASKGYLQAVISWYLACSNSQAHRNISFYGGEPLLCFDEIICAIQFAMKSRSGRGSLSFSITTNGTLLSLERARALLEHDVYINISLDGNRETHNWARVDPTGNGSFDIVLANLRTLWNHFGTDLNHRIGLLATIDPTSWGSDLTGWLELLREFPFLQGFRRKANSLSYPRSRNSPYRSRLSADEAQKTEMLIGFFRTSVLQKNTASRELIGWVFDEDLARIHKRKRVPLQRQVYTSGCCIPGTERLYATLDGKLYPCEKVDQRFAIGTVDEGIKLDRIRLLLQQWHYLLRDVCNGCWAIRFCSKCLASVSDWPSDASAMKRICALVQANWAQNLWFYCSIREESDEAFDYLGDWMV